MNAKFTDFPCLPDAVTQIIQLRPADAPATTNVDIYNIRRVHHKRTLDTFIADEAANGEPLVDSAPAPGNHGAVECLNALFLTFEDATTHVDRIPNAERRKFRF